MHFPWQKSYEHTKLILRRHWLVLFFIYLEFGFILIAGSILFLFLDSALASLGQSGTQLTIFLFLLFLFIFWELLFLALTDYYLDTWIVTDHRIVDIQQLGLFRRDVSELRLANIQDVSVKVKGLLHTFFNYGDIIIQTAGTVQEFHFQQIPNPYRVKDTILHLYDEFTKTHKDNIEIHETSIQNLK